MKDNDLNLLILQELIRIANEVFASMVIKLGTYTAAELAKLKDGKGNDITISFAEPDKIYRIEVDSFKCSFPENRIFYLVWQFESECGIKQKDKARFTRVEEKEVVCEFKMRITKEQTKLAKMVGNDPCRPVMNYIHLDHCNKSIVATNGRIMKEYKVDIESVDIPEGLNLYIEPKHIKELVGSCSVCVKKENDIETITEITNEQGKVFVCDYSGKYPNYRRVYPKLSKDGYIKVRKNELKSVSAFVQSVKKNKYNDTFTLETISGERKIYLSYEDIDFAQSKVIIVELEEPAKIDIRLGLKADVVIPMLSGWTGGLWLVSPCNAVVFDDKEAVAGLVMPACIDNAIYPGRMELNVNAYELLEALSEAKYIKENNLPALYVASENDVVAFVSALSDAIKSISDTFYKEQIKETLERLKKLSELSGIPMDEIIPTECKEIKEEPSVRIEEVMQPEVLPEAYKGVERLPYYRDVAFPFPRLLRCMDAHAAQPYRQSHIGSICNVMLSLHCLRRRSAKFSSLTEGLSIAYCRRLRKKGNHRIRDGTIKNDSRIMIEIIN